MPVRIGDLPFLRLRLYNKHQDKPDERKKIEAEAQSSLVSCRLGAPLTDRLGDPGRISSVPSFSKALPLGCWGGSEVLGRVLRGEGWKTREMQKKMTGSRWALGQSL